MSTPLAKIKQGAIAIETAIVIPVFVAMALGAIDLTRYFHTKAVVENAAYLGAMHAASSNYSAATLPTWQADVNETIVAVLEKLPLFDSSLVQVEIEPMRDGNQPLFTLSVMVQYEFQPLVLGTFTTTHIPVRRTMTARRFR